MTGTKKVVMKCFVADITACDEKGVFDDPAAISSCKATMIALA